MQHPRDTSVHELVKLHLERRVDIVLAALYPSVRLLVSDESQFRDHFCSAQVVLS